MQKTSTAYQAEMAKPIRGQGHMRVEVGVVDIDAAEDAAASGSTGLYYSVLGGIVHKRVPENTYASFEPDRWKCDASQLVPSHKYMLEQGFISEVMADENGDFSPQPYVRFSFSKPHTVPALSFVFDASCGDYPEKMRVKAYRNGAVVFNGEVEPDASVYVLRQRLERFDMVEIVFLKAKQPYRRARLQQVIFGMGLVFTNNEIKKANIIYERDPVCRRLPKGEFKFTILNYDGAYDLDNPEGVWRDMELRTPLVAEIGQELTGGITWDDVYMNSGGWAAMELSRWETVKSGGIIEGVPAGRFFLTSAPSAHKNEVNFTATDILGLMTEKYYKGGWEKESLYSLAEKILKDAGLPLMPDGTKPWRLWEGLADIEVENPPPILAGRELLQMVAHAAMCVLYVNREGRICIEPMPDEVHDAYISLESAFNLPDVDKTAVLAGVDVRAVAYSVPENESELVKGEYYGSQQMHFEFGSPVKDVRVLLEGASGDAKVYAQAVDVNVNAKGAFSLKIFGKKAGKSTVSARVAANILQENAFWNEQENPLVAKQEHAKAVAEWLRDYLCLRNTYKINYRGNPEIDALDTVYAQSRFSGRFAAYVLRNEISFDGAVRGKMIFKAAEEG